MHVYLLDFSYLYLKKCKFISWPGYCYLQKRFKRERSSISDLNVPFLRKKRTNCSDVERARTRVCVCECGCVCVSRCEIERGSFVRLCGCVKKREGVCVCVCMPQRERRCAKERRTACVCASESKN